MQFSEIFQKINSDKRLKPDLMKSENGNNFRAISESAILDVIEPILKESGWFYTVTVKEQHLDIKEAYGKNGKKLQFIAWLSITVTFINKDSVYNPLSLAGFGDNMNWIAIDSVGMGIDDNDKAMGKAYTYALKYALLKLFRLRYGDDPDFEASKPLNVEKPVEKKVEKAEVKKGATKKEQLMSENQRDYILGLMKEKGIPESMVIGKFGYEPSQDEEIPMKVARGIIEYLQNYEDLPF